MARVLNLTDDFLVADKPLKHSDVINITESKTIVTKEREMDLGDMFWRTRVYLKYAFFGYKSVNCSEEFFSWHYEKYITDKYIIYSWNITKALNESIELVEENPWEVYGMLSADHTEIGVLKHFVFSTISEVFAFHPTLFQIFGPVGFFEHEDNPTIEDINDYGYAPSEIRLAEVVFLQEYMLNSYSDRVTEKLEKLREKDEKEYSEEVKDIARFRKEIIIALDEFYLIEDSLLYQSDRDFVRYGKQKRNLDFMYEILRVRTDELSKISADMNNVIMQEKMTKLTAIPSPLTNINTANFRYPIKYLLN